MFSDIQTDIAPNSVARYIHTGDLEAEVAELAQPLIDEGKTPGVAVGVLLEDGSREYYGFGTVERNRQENPDNKTAVVVLQNSLYWTERI